MKKRTLSIFLLLFVLCTMSFTTVAFAKTLTKTHVFTTKKIPFYYNDYDDYIMKNGTRYNFDYIKYKELSHTGGRSETRSFNNLKSKSVPEYQTFDGRRLRLAGTPSYNEVVPDNLTATKVYKNLKQSEISSIPSVVHKNAVRQGKSVSIALERTSKDIKNTPQHFTYTKTISTDEDKTKGGIHIDKSLQSQSNYKVKIRKLFGHPSYYTVTSAYFSSSLIEHDDDSFERKVTYSGYRDYKTCSAHYKEPDSSVNKYATYNATARYTDGSNIKYKVKALVTYSDKAPAITRKSRENAGDKSNKIIKSDKKQKKSEKDKNKKKSEDKEKDKKDKEQDKNKPEVENGTETESDIDDDYNRKSFSDNGSNTALILGLSIGFLVLVIIVTIIILNKEKLRPKFDKFKHNMKVRFKK